MTIRLRDHRGGDWKALRLKPSHTDNILLAVDRRVAGRQGRSKANAATSPNQAQR